MGYTVRIKDLAIYAYNGVNPEEQALGQIFLISVELHTNLDDVITDDEIENTVNYSRVSKFISKWMTEHSFQLIERVAYHLCREILLRFNGVQSISLEVKKPNAPIRNMHFDYVSVQKDMAWHEVYLSLGSNAKNAPVILEKAEELIRSNPDIRAMVCSKTITTPAVGDEYEGIFLNNAIKMETLLSPDMLHQLLRSIEADLGRDRSREGGVRTIDIDILLYDDLVQSTEDYILPYPNFEGRTYTIIPMCEIGPNVYHPILKKTMRKLRKELQERQDDRR